MNRRPSDRVGIVAGIDPTREWHLPVAWAADEAHRRRLPLSLVVAQPVRGDARGSDGAHLPSSARHAAAQTLREAGEWAGLRHRGLVPVLEVADGSPAAVLGGMSREARMVVLGSRHLSRTEEYLSAGSVVVPVAAQATCPVVVVGDAEHVTQQPPYLVVGVDGSPHAQAALAFAFEEAALRGAALRAIAVWQAPVFALHDEETALRAQRALLAEATAGWPGKYPDVRLTREVPVGHPVEELAAASEHALAAVVGRRGRGGYTGMRLGSVVHGMLHRAHCPVVIVPAD
ncbi:universal stress protein [Streptomyces sp. NRRL S-87]|uniref:universal stress protein n=1 Tax=Streptomyces sp. NRRL S-87 TaxID=1463920 RepID=UPI0004BF310B|nr:universal stress protein [Streptomyces sp. NRRL S-87]